MQNSYLLSVINLVLKAHTTNLLQYSQESFLQLDCLIAMIFSLPVFMKIKCCLKKKVVQLLLFCLEHRR